ncbi:RNA polymerase II C-terminal domain kinase beta subunit [Sporothrix bragantina]|uniref:RNA polymerase II holoenzyme cyclin-like subunit n=1 Tax=Sporothrix bragantina TaxID=671064 RepID=A0ABP0CCH0_9PEZI
MGRRGPRHGGGGGGGGGGFRQGGGNNGGNNGGSGSGNNASAPPSKPIIITEPYPAFKGPVPGFVSVASQYTLEHQLRQMQRDNGCDPTREDSYRLQGVQLIDNVRQELRLPVKTFATACTYYHKFRLNFRDAEYSYQDAALAALFVACKVEDTIKKSREVLCAALNFKNPDNPFTPDNKVFDRQSNVIIGLDRLILQTVGFDFRTRHPQKVLVKLIRSLIPSDDARDFLAVAYPMSIDMYKTFAPIKQTSFTMAIAIIELTARIRGTHIDRVRYLTTTAGGSGSSSDYHSSRACIVETLLDLLDLYTQFAKSTQVGARFPLDAFVNIKIQINQEVADDPGLHRTASYCETCAPDEGDAPGGSILPTPGSATSPATTGSLPGTSNVVGPVIQSKLNPMKNGETMRFLFDVNTLRQEREEMAEYFKEEYTEETIEVEELIPEPTRGGGQQQNGNRNNQNNQNNGNRNQNQNQHHGPSRRERNNNHHHPGGNGESGWGPYQRNRNNQDRHKPRKSGGHY